MELPKLKESKSIDEKVFECKCGSKLSSSDEIDEHFKSCYQMFLVYGNLMKAFTGLLESAKEESKLQINLCMLLK